MLKFISIMARLLIRFIANVERIDEYKADDVRDGGLIVVCNHLGRLDAVLALTLSDRDDVILMIAEKYQYHWFWNWIGQNIDAIWLDRHQADIGALREVIKRLKQGGVLAMAPEGTRSKTEALLEGKPGATYLAARTGIPVLPLGITGTEDRIVKHRLKCFKRLDITIRAGDPFIIPPIDRKNRDQFLHDQTEEMMCRIAAILPPKYRGVYADHLRVQELLAEEEGDVTAVA